MQDGPNPKSTANIGGHPIHPMLVPFPIAFFVSAFVCDVVSIQTGAPRWATVSTWLIGAGLVMAVLAAIVGAIEVAGSREVRRLRDVWLHAGGNVLAVLVQLLNIYLRFGTSGSVASGLQTGLSALVVVILLFTGWKGWGLVYRHHVGVAD